MTENKMEKLTPDEQSKIPVDGCGDEAVVLNEEKEAARVRCMGNSSSDEAGI